MIDKSPDKRLVIIGAGGHARVVIDVARAAGFEPFAALDPGNIGSTCNGVKVIGGDDMIGELFAQGLRVGVVAIGDNRMRVKLGDRLESMGVALPVIAHPSAILSPSARIGAGTVIMPLAIVNAAADIGRLVVLNSSAVVEHDCRIGDGAHVAPGCRLGGTVSVGVCTLLGIGTVIRPEARVGGFSVIGAGSTVIADIGEHMVVTGSPAKARRSI